jgi:hypothetical protein
VLRRDREGDLLQIVVDKLGLGPRLEDVSASGRLRPCQRDILRKAGDERLVVAFPNSAGCPIDVSSAAASSTSVISG